MGHLSRHEAEGWLLLVVLRYLELGSGIVITLGTNLHGIWSGLANSHREWSSLYRHLKISKSDWRNLLLRWFLLLCGCLLLVLGLLSKHSYLQMVKIEDG